MKIQVISFHCVLKNKLGQFISSSFNQEVITHSASAPEMLSGLADGLQNLVKGEKRRIVLKAENAYGFYDPGKVMTRPFRDFHAEKPIRVGDRVALQGPNGETKFLRVTDANEAEITLDGNHPLAGQDLVFEIEATEVRDATPEEIADSVAPSDESTSHHKLH